MPRWPTYIEQVFVPPFRTSVPKVQRLPVVLASPHSGSYYPPTFVSQSCQEKKVLRRSEDAFVDNIIERAPKAGLPTIKAVYPRSFVDLNRAGDELDPAMFEMPEDGNEQTFAPLTERTQAGYGMIPSVISQGVPIYDQKLPFDEAENRINRIYAPYHTALSQIIDETQQQFGCAYLLDCHSMPSWSVMSLSHAANYDRVDVVLGDRFGKTAQPEFMMFLEKFFADQGLNVVRNHPYAGGFCTEHYGQPERQQYAVQIELNRALYMDERNHTIQRLGMKRLQNVFGHLYDALTEHFAQKIQTQTAAE